MRFMSALILTLLVKVSLAQTVYIPSGTGGIGTSTNGNIGVGTNAPVDQLEIVTGNRKVGLNGTVTGATTGGLLSLSRSDGTKTLLIGTTSGVNDNVIFGRGGSAEMRFVSGGGSSVGFGFYLNINEGTAFGGTRPTPVMKIDGLGNVGIGTTSPDSKLTVNGQVHAVEVKVTATVPAPDYVFDARYDLRSLEDVEVYIDQNHHLPEVPSAREMEVDGIKVGEMNLLLLKKVEELTLNVIQLKKEIDVLKSNK